MKNDALGDRMKQYEGAEAGRRFMPMCPVIARIDGKCFSRFTRGMAKPYDEAMMTCMIDTAMSMAQETEPRIAYTQSDEITLIWLQDSHKSEIFHGARIQKMTSILASLATAAFAEARFTRGLKAGQRALFDARVWQVPTKQEAVNTLIWREHDATRNSILGAASSVYSHNQCFGRKVPELMDMLMSKGINWNDYPAPFKRGTYIQRVVRVGRFTSEEIESLPPLHDARKNPNATFERSSFEIADLPPMTRIENRVDVVFEGASATRASGQGE